MIVTISVIHPHITHICVRKKNFQVRSGENTGIYMQYKRDIVSNTLFMIYFSASACLENCLFLCVEANMACHDDDKRECDLLFKGNKGSSCRYSD